MSRRAVVVASLAVLAVLGYGVLDAVDIVPGVLTSDLSRAGAAPPVAAPSSGPAAGSRPGPGPGASPAPGDVPAPLPPLDPAAPGPAVAPLAALLRPALADPRLGPAVGAQVRDAATGRVLFASGQDVPRTPASATKLLTAAAVSSTLDLRSTFTTRVVRGRGRDDIVLVAGGDALLAAGAGNPGAVAGRVGLGDLAASTVRALGPRSRPVRVLLDDRYARGPALAPGWAPADVATGLTGPVAMIGLASDRATPYRPATADPGMTTARAFAAALAAHGVRTATAPARGAAPAGAAQLAAGSSAPAGEVLALALADSDNDLTETVARQACVRAGVAPTFPACAAWVRGRLRTLGVDVRRVVLADTSGLSPGTRVPVRVISEVLRLAADGRHPGLTQVVSGLPVAGLSGTLHERYLAPPTHGAAGIVRAKTGTLTGTSALAGWLVDASGRLLTFAVVADRVPAGGTLGARAALDVLATRLAACGCR